MPLSQRPSENSLPRISKDCFGTVIASLRKMKECVRCELLAECRAINWTGEEGASGPVVARRRDEEGDASEGAAGGAK